MFIVDLGFSSCIGVDEELFTHVFHLYWVEEAAVDAEIESLSLHYNWEPLCRHASSTEGD